MREAVTGSHQRGLRGFRPLLHQKLQLFVVEPTVLRQVFHQPGYVQRVLEHLRDLQPDPDEAPGLGQASYTALPADGGVVGVGKIME